MIINEVLLIINAILKEINPNTPTRPKKDIIVPNEITLLEPALEKLCTNAGLVLLEKQSIQYGVKIIVKQGYRRVCSPNCIS
ncbi:hypothetical protein VB776_08690 [Arcicella sp. DC2W]|uniref:Uncharacterized protein n=1 Tax=Arcicella gelida TaxID=2984195 RepID=A0ABU5S3D4_9BACT|nr:hypothetical protein [Arcicella sp. DC2W]MEA5402989.1 hypothetical protein [Arcicella sp. DC2W]